MIYKIVKSDEINGVPAYYNILESVNENEWRLCAVSLTRKEAIRAIKDFENKEFKRCLDESLKGNEK